MKKLKIYVIVDVVSETILNVFSAISNDLAIRQFKQALEANKDKIYDKESIKLLVPKSVFLNSDQVSVFTYSVPESYDEVKEYFEEFNF